MSPRRLAGLGLCGVRATLERSSKAAGLPLNAAVLLRLAGIEPATKPL